MDSDACIIVIKVKGVELPKEEHLRNCALRNKDGTGVAFIKEGETEIRIKKDFENLDKFIKWFYDNIKKEDVCIIHFRFATHGLVDIGNRHPFPITKNKEMLRKSELICQMAVAHNGVISSYGHHEKFSDTQKFILDILSDDVVKNNISNPAVQKLISNFLSGDRLAILLTTGAVYTWGNWEKEGELFYSNDGYKERNYIVNHWFTNHISNSNKTGYNEICDGCGKQKYVQIVDEDEYGYTFLLCKSCRKQYRKGKLALDEKQNKKEIDLTELQKITISEIQCESCLSWVEKSQITNYYGHKLCQKCLDDVCYNGQSN